MNMKIGKLFASLTTLISTVALAACAMSPYEGKYSHEDGWRKARIQETGSLEQLAGKYGYTCSSLTTQIFRFGGCSWPIHRSRRPEPNRAAALG